MPYNRYITSEKRTEIINAIRMKLDTESIMKIFNVSRNSISRIKNGHHNIRNGKSSSYDKRILQGQVKKAILKLKKLKIRITARDILQNIHEELSLRTLQKFLRSSDIFQLRNIPKKIVLNDYQKSTRVTAIKSWLKSNIDFNKVIYSDECRFSLDGPDYFLSWQLHNDENSMFRSLRAFGGGSQMIFGYINVHGLLSIKFIDGTIDSEKYLSILNDEVIPDICQNFGDDFIWQQDNARPHTAKKITNYFINNNVKVLPWPPHSPDLSIIENVWKVLKDAVYNGPDIKNKEELNLRITQSVEKINSNPEAIKSLYDGIVERYLKVLKRDGSNKKQ